MACALVAAPLAARAIFHGRMLLEGDRPFRTVADDMACRVREALRTMVLGVASMEEGPSFPALDDIRPRQATAILAKCRALVGIASPTIAIVAADATRAATSTSLEFS